MGLAARSPIDHGDSAHDEVRKRVGVDFESSHSRNLPRMRLEAREQKEPTERASG
jgi:hypothetical protein